MLVRQGNMVANRRSNMLANRRSNMLAKRGGNMVANMANMLNCKINSTNGGTFCKSAGKLFWVFFLVQGA